MYVNMYLTMYLTDIYLSCIKIDDNNNNNNNKMANGEIDRQRIENKQSIINQ